MCEVKKTVRKYIQATKTGTRKQEAELLKRLEQLSGCKGCLCKKED